MVEMKLVVNESSENLSSRLVFPTPGEAEKRPKNGDAERKTTEEGGGKSVSFGRLALPKRGKNAREPPFSAHSPESPITRSLITWS